MTETITSGQRKQIKRFCEDALEGLNISREAAQRVIEQGGSLQRNLRSVIRQLGESSYSNGKIASTRCYPDGFEFRSVGQQVATLLEYFPGLDVSHAEELASQVRPVGAEGVAVVPKLSVIASGDFHLGLVKSLIMLGKTREIRNLFEETLTSKYLRLTDNTAVAHTKLDESPGDVWVFPFQFGMLHRDSSFRARVSFGGTEFGLSPYEGTILMLTHPDRITSFGQLYVDCAGCEYLFPTRKDCLCFRWSSASKCLEMTFYGLGHPIREWGVASGFLPSATAG